LRQLVEQGFNPLAVIAEKTGRSMGELRKDMEKGLITYDMVEGALKDLTSAGGRFYGAIERGASTTEGKIAKLNDSILGLKVAFGTGFNEGLKTALDATNSFLPQLEMKFSKAGELVGNAIKNSISGNHDMIAGVGAVLGETLMAGVRSAIKIGISSLIRDGIGGYVSLGGSITGNPETKVAGAAISSGIGSALGPRESMAEIIKGETDGIDRAVKALEKIANDQKAKMWDEQLRKQVAATEELVRQGRQSTGVGLYPTSR
jgi:hypothetical protein